MPGFAIPANAGIQKKDWVPGQARNDKLEKMCVVVYENKRAPHATERPKIKII